MGSWKGRGNQYIQFIRVLYSKLPNNGKQLPAFPLEAMPGNETLASEVGVLPLCHRGLFFTKIPSDTHQRCIFPHGHIWIINLSLWSLSDKLNNIIVLLKSFYSIHIKINNHKL